jgi:hypothetical protein
MSPSTRERGHGRFPRSNAPKPLDGISAAINSIAPGVVAEQANNIPNLTIALGTTPATVNYAVWRFALGGCP